MRGPCRNAPLAHYFLGLINVNHGGINEAKSHPERFLRLAPNDRHAKSACGMLEYLRKR